MSITPLISRLKKENVHVRLSGADLEVEFGNGVADKAIVSELKEKKHLLIEYLKGLSGRGFSSIPIAELQDYYPLSHAQKRVWVSDQLQGQRTAYTISGAFLLEGALDVSSLKRAFETVILRHESLRTVFITMDDEPFQKIMPPDETGYRFEYIDDDKLPDEPEVLQHLHNEEAERRFDLSSGPLIRTRLIRLSTHRYFFLLTLHHIVSDGWSLEILINEVLRLYDSYVGKESVAFEPLQIQYKDYAVWQNSLLAGTGRHADLEYWREQLAGDLPVLDLPSDLKRPAVKGFSGSACSSFIEGDLQEKMNAVCRQEGVSLFMLLITALKCLLYRYTGQTDIIVGSPVAGRGHADLEEQIGFFVNTLAIRTRIDGKESFTRLLANVKDVMLGAYDHQYYPFDKLLEELHISRDVSRTPVFDVVASMHNSDYGGGMPRVFKDISVNEFPSRLTVTKFDLTFNFLETDRGILVNIEYSTALFKEERIKRMALHYRNLLEKVVQDAGISLDDIEYLDPSERHQQLVEFNDRYLYNYNKTIVQAFEEQVKTTPGNIALKYEGTATTYEALNRQANRLGRYLRERYDIRPDQLIGIMVDTSDRLVTGILGILKSGAGFVPIDPGLPVERIRYMLQDAGIKVILTDSHQLFHEVILEREGEFLLLLDTVGEELENYPAEDIAPVNTDRHLAYVMYTSGSTGKPKGVMIEHRGVVSLVKDNGFVRLDGDSVLLITGSPSFDASTFEHWGMLLNGGTLVLSPRDTLLDISRLKRELVTNEVNTIWFTSSWFNELVDTDILVFEGLSTVIVGGEKLSVYHIRKFIDRYPYIEIINGYGPTENTTFSLTCKISGADSMDSIPIGRPFNGRIAVVIDVAGQLCPVGVYGELCVGGSGLARGYLNLPELTAAKFISDPYMGTGRLYRTGDICRWLEGGTVEFLERTDNQVKIRGFRIELDEISGALAGYAGIDSALTLIRRLGDGSAIVGYYKSGEEVEEGELHRHLQTLLPAYMMPDYLVRIFEYPLTENGKLNERELPDPELTCRRSGAALFVAPADELQRKLVKVCEKILGRTGIGILDNLFSIGCDSIKAIRMVSEITKELQLAAQVKDVFTYPTISGLSAFLREGNSLPEPDEKRRVIREGLVVLKDDLLSRGMLKLPAGDPEDIYPMSDIQKGMLYHSLADPSLGMYHDQIYFQIEDHQFDQELFEKAIFLLIRNHSIFRTAFAFVDNHELQLVYDPATVRSDIGFEDISAMGAADREAYLDAFLVEDRLKGFDISRPGLWRFRIYRLPQEQYGILFIFHHAILDGWSDASFKTELSNVYFNLKTDARYRPAPLKASYKDYVIDQLKAKNDPVLRQYWKEYLADYARTPLPLEKEPTALRPEANSVHEFKLGNTLMEEIEKQTRELGLTHKSIYLAAFCQLIRLTTNADDLVIGLSTNGRPEMEDGDKVLGCFLNTVPFRANSQFALKNRDLIRGIDALVVESKQYDKLSLLEISNLTEKDPGATNPIFDIMFTYLDFHVYGGMHTESSVQKPLVQGFSKGNTFFTFSILREDGGTAILIDTLAGCYTGQELVQLETWYKNILFDLLFDPGGQIRFERNIITSAEKAVLLKPVSTAGIHYDKTLIELFEAQVARAPNNIALSYKEVSMTYRELNEKSNRLGLHLRQTYATGPDDIVGIMVDRSEWAVIAILSVLKSGAAYLSIDVANPEERITYILGDAGARLLITDSQHLFNDAVLNYRGQVMAIDIDQEIGGAHPIPNIPKINTSRNLAYIVYTSGSTGKPKGAMIEHAAVNNMIFSLIREFSVDDGDKLLQFASFSFDASVYEIFTALCAGAELVLADKAQIIDTRGFIDYIREKKVSIINLPPSYLSALDLGELAFLRVVITAGQAAKVPDAIRVSEFADYYNAYGPSECAVCVSTYKVQPSDRDKSGIPIGRPIDHTNIYILSSSGLLLPSGVSGEICISGPGLARGYLNKEALTAEKFIENPFDAQARLYRTGDVGKWLPDGNLAFLGRKDSQVKIRGYRIEPGEIESVYGGFPGITSALVIAREQNGEKMLICYYTAGGPVDEGSLKKYVEAKLPEYMIPRYSLRLPAYPLTVSGKIDNNKLPDPSGPGTGQSGGSKPAVNEKERVLLSAWREILGTEEIGIADNFFEVGGDSIKAIQVCNRVFRSGYKLEIRDLFEFPTIERLAEITERLVEEDIAGEMIVQGRVGLTPIQHWFFSSLQKKASHYNQAVLLDLQFRTDVDGIRAIMQKIQEHHDALRMRFDNASGYCIQTNYSIDYPLYVSEIDISKSDSPERELTGRAEELQASIDLEKGPMMRVALFRTPAGDKLLIIVHHLVIDAFSWRILLEDFQSLYVNYQSGGDLFLPVKTDPFMLWSERLYEYANSKECLAEIPYWLKLERIPAVSIVNAAVIRNNTIRNSRQMSFELTTEDTALLLTRVNQAFGTEINDILLTGLILALNQTFGHKRMLITLEGHGREEILKGVNISRTIGWFTSVYPVLLEITDDEDLSHQIIFIKETLRNIPKKGVGYGILKYLTDTGNRQDLTFRMDPEICFNYLGQFDTELNRESFKMASEGYGLTQSEETTRDHLLDISGIVLDRRLTISTLFTWDVFSEQLIAGLNLYYRQSLEKIIRHCASKSQREVTPSDLSYKKLSLDELNKINARFR